MPIVEKTERDFLTDVEREAYVTRANGKWRVAMNCWFWLCGPGSTAPDWYREGRYRWLTKDEQRKAEIDRRVNGWNEDTLREVRRLNDQRRALSMLGAPAERPQKRSSSRRARADTGVDPTLDNVSAAFAAPRKRALPPDVARDYPETFDLPDDQRHALRAAAFAGKMPYRERQALSAVAEVIYDGDDLGNW